MDNESTINWFLAFLATAGILLNTTIMLLSRKGQVAKARSDDADAYESLSATVASLSTQVKELRIELDVERRARVLAEQLVAKLQTKIEQLEAKYNRDVSRLTQENHDLKEAMDIMVDEGEDREDN